MGNKQVYSDPTEAEAIDKVEKGRKKQKMKTSASCFASRRGKCSVLNVNKCGGSSCVFYKTQAQIGEARAEAYKRIKSLDKATQPYIFGTYYGGKMPCLKGGFQYDC